MNGSRLSIRKPMRRPSQPSFRDTIAENNKAMRGMEAMFGDLREAKGVAKPELMELAPKRAYTPRAGTKEKTVKQKIREALRADPRVAFVWNEISGQFGDLRVGFVGKPDLVGMLKGGALFAIETKRAHGGITSLAQTACIEMIIEHGGKAGVASSVQEALAIIS